MVDPVVVGATHVEAGLAARETEGKGAADEVGTAAQIPAATRACSLASTLYSGHKSKHCLINFYAKKIMSIKG